MNQQPNPKEVPGASKPGVACTPLRVLFAVDRVLAHGAAKYGAFNWRASGIKASTYVSAMMRHLVAWAEREDNDQDSGEHPLAHLAANVFVVLDALAHGKLEDDRLGGDPDAARKEAKFQAFIDAVTRPMGNRRKEVEAFVLPGVGPEASEGMTPRYSPQVGSTEDGS